MPGARPRPTPKRSEGGSVRSWLWPNPARAWSIACRWSLPVTLSRRALLPKCRWNTGNRTCGLLWRSRSASNRANRRRRLRAGLVAGSFLVRVALLGPGVRVDVVPPLLPEPAVVRRGELQLPQPLRALPRVALRDHQPQRIAVLRGELLAFVRPGQQDVVIGHR